MKAGMNLRLFTSKRWIHFAVMLSVTVYQMLHFPYIILPALVPLFLLDLILLFCTCTTKQNTNSSRRFRIFDPRCLYRIRTVCVYRTKQISSRTEESGIFSGILYSAYTRLFKSRSSFARNKWLRDERIPNTQVKRKKADFVSYALPTGKQKSRNVNRIGGGGGGGKGVGQCV